MGPITLFDKSFLQSLSVDESLWFDHFFLINVCPLFYVETLADLEKSVRRGRTPEEEVGQIADKFPQMHGSPSMNHVDLCVGELLGHAVPMTGQIPLAGGRTVKFQGKGAAVFEPSPEAEAFSRWQEGEFLEVERQFAQTWRRALSALDPQEVAEELGALGVNATQCRTLKEARDEARAVVSACDSYGVEVALLFLSVPHDYHELVRKAWTEAGNPPLSEYAPYAAYVLTVEIFFQIALASDLISGARPSNRVDVAYLFYLPFCMMFVSSDRLHERIVPLFLREDQAFIWGPTLKKGLGEINSHYLAQPNKVRDEGVITFADSPPETETDIVTELWRRFLPRLFDPEEAKPAENSAGPSPSAEEITGLAQAPTVSPGDVDFKPTDPGAVVIKRRVRRKKGSWYQIPKDHKASS